MTEYLCQTYSMMRKVTAGTRRSLGISRKRAAWKTLYRLGLLSHPDRYEGRNLSRTTSRIRSPWRVAIQSCKACSTP